MLAGNNVEGENALHRIGADSDDLNRGVIGDVGVHVCREWPV